MSGAVPCLSTDLTTHAVPHLIQALQMRRRAAPKARGAECARRRARDSGDDDDVRGSGNEMMMALCADRTMGEGAKRGKVKRGKAGA